VPKTFCVVEPTKRVCAIVAGPVHNARADQIKEIGKEENSRRRVAIGVGHCKVEERNSVL
jgi:hypothetical protein